MRIFLALLVLGIAFTARAEEARTTETFITSSEGAVTSAITRDFTLYIGDQIAGVTDPVKSVYVAVSGVYDGSGSVTLSVDGNPASEQTYTLPNASEPTQFEIIYVDPTGSIAPVSAGSYDHSFTIDPSGVTLFGLAAKAIETHEYVAPSCPDGASANEKVKTSEFLVESSTDEVTDPIVRSFTLYIGDAISGIVDSMKSGYFLIQGVYDGSGSLDVSLDGYPLTETSFSLPNASEPAEFELLYHDGGNIAPTSAGSYERALALNPGGTLVLYGLGIRFVETHQYAPPSCGGMPVKGELYSAVFDTTGRPEGPAYNALLWKGTLGGPGLNEGRVRFQLAASECANGATNPPTCSAGTWSFIGGDTCSSGDWFDPGAPDMPYDLSKTACVASWNDKRYFRYAVEICSDECTLAGGYTPTVEEVIVNWSP